MQPAFIAEGAATRGHPSGLISSEFAHMSFHSRPHPEHHPPNINRHPSDANSSYDARSPRNIDLSRQTAQHQASAAKNIPSTSISPPSDLLRHPIWQSSARHSYDSFENSPHDAISVRTVMPVDSGMGAMHVGKGATHHQHQHRLPPPPLYIANAPLPRNILAVRDGPSSLLSQQLHRAACEGSMVRKLSTASAVSSNRSHTSDLGISEGAPRTKSNNIADAAGATASGGRGSGAGGGGDCSSSDDCEEVTRRIINSAYPSHSRNHSNHHEQKGSWGTQHTRSGLSDSSQPSRLLSPRESGDAPSVSTLTAEEVLTLERRRLSRNDYHLTSGQAALELFMRLNHARQTLDFVKRQASMFATLDRAKMDVWQALDCLNELREYEAALMAGISGGRLDPDVPLRDHAMQTAELCRLAHPDKDWLHLVGLMHGLGKLLAHKMFGSQPQWAACGESFPLGCRFDSNIQGTQFFTANPDRRRRQYNTQLGIYTPGCGLQNVFMSWSAAEFLYLLLLLNDTALPREALFIVRHQKFTVLTKPGSSAYRFLLSPEDEAMLPLLASFQKLSAYKRVAMPEDKVLSPEMQAMYYSSLMDKYLGSGMRKLAW